jgi:high-affinity nickel permease
MGVSIVALFVLSWITSILTYKWMGYHRLETVPARD